MKTMTVKPLDLSPKERAQVIPLLYRESDRLERIAAEAREQGLTGHAGVYEDMRRDVEAMIVKFRLD
jgi:hypothetical protein